MIIPIPFLGWIEIEDSNDVEGTSKAADKNDTASSNDGRSNDHSIVEAKDHQGTGNSSQTKS